jgi:mRNA interferase RelE/StbE
VACTVWLLPAAEREWRKLPREIRTRVNRALLALEDTPRPHGATKLSGSSDRWRVRVGDYRIIYRIDDVAHEVTVLRIAHRRQVSRRS